MLPLMCSHPLAAGMGGPVSVVSSTTASYDVDAVGLARQSAWLAAKPQFPA